MKLKLRHILVLIIIVVLGYFLLTYFNTNGRLFPIKNSISTVHPTDVGFQIIDFKTFTITLPNGWKDKGFRAGSHADIYGTLRKNLKLINYEYGHLITPPTETLHEFLFMARTHSVIMADEVKVGETDTTVSVKYVYPIPSETSDTVRTGKLTDSVLDQYPKPKISKILIGEPNYYSLTKYNDSVYFIPIEVPEVIVNSTITNLDSLGYKYNIVLPTDQEKGYTKITINKDDFFPVVLWAEELDSFDQEMIIKVAKSLRFKDASLNQ